LKNELLTMKLVEVSRREGRRSGPAFATPE